MCYLPQLIYGTVCGSGEESFFFPCGYPLEPALFIGKLILSPLLCSAKSISGHGYVSLCLDYSFHWSNSLSLHYYVPPGREVERMASNQ